MANDKEQILNKLEEKLLKNPEYKGYVSEQRKMRELKKQTQNQQDFFVSLLDTVQKTLSELAQEKSSDPLKILAKNNEAVCLVAEAITLLSKEIREENEKQSIKELTEIKKSLNKISEKEIPAPIVKVAPQTFNIPEPKIIDKSSIVQETKYAEKAGLLLEAILKTMLGIKLPDSTYIKNSNPDEAIPVVLTNASKKSFYDAIMQAFASSGGGGKNYLSGIGIDFQILLSSANTWIPVPPPVAGILPPSSPFLIIVSKEVATGTIRYGFQGFGTPGTTNGNQMFDRSMSFSLGGGQKLYFSSTVNTDALNVTCKEI